MREREALKSAYADTILIVDNLRFLQSSLESGNVTLAEVADSMHNSFELLADIQQTIEAVVPMQDLV